MVSFRNPVEPDVPGGGREQLLSYVLVDSVLGPLPGFRIQDDFACGQDNRVFQRAHRALSNRVEEADGLQLVPEKLESQRPAVQRGIYVEHAAPAAQIAVILNERYPEEPALDQPSHKILRVGALSGKLVIHIGNKNLRRDNTLN